MVNLVRYFFVDRHILTETISYYKHLFSAKPSVEPEPLLDELRAAPLTNAESNLLEHEITYQEVDKALGSMAKGKAPGPDGLGAAFYHKFKNFLTPRLSEVFKEAQKRKTKPYQRTSRWGTSRSSIKKETHETYATTGPSPSYR